MSEKVHLGLGLTLLGGGIALIWYNPAAIIIPAIMTFCGAVVSAITIYRIHKGYGK